jgi:hypothetical protein
MPTKKDFPRVQIKERKRLKTGMIAVIASSLAIEEGKGKQTTSWKLMYKSQEDHLSRSYRISETLWKWPKMYGRLSRH